MATPPGEPPPANLQGGQAAVAWCEDERLLGSLYCFHHLQYGELQSEAHYRGCLDILSRFLERLESDADEEGEEQEAHDGQGGRERKRTGPAEQLVEEEQKEDADVADADVAPADAALQAADRRALVAALQLISSQEHAWHFGKYGCVLLLLPPSSDSIQPDPGRLHLLLVGLDEWSFSVHSTSDGRNQHVAACQGGAVVPCGSLPAAELAAFRSALFGVLAKAEKERRGDDRSARGGKQGNQRTPGFIRALVLQALEQVAAGPGAEVAERLPLGGFADVGLHTGGKARDTAWPLAREALKAALECVEGCRSATPDLCSQAFAHLHLWLTQRQVALLTPSTATSLARNAVVRMLHAAAHAAAELVHAGHDMAHFLAACEACRRQIDKMVLLRAQAAAARQVLPDLEGEGGSSLCSPDSYRWPQGVVPPKTTPRVESGSTEAVRQRAAANLGSLQLPPEASPTGRLTFGQLLGVVRQLEKRQPQTDVSVQHALCLVERELFSVAAGGRLAAVGELLSEAEVGELVEVVEAYRRVLHSWRATSAPAARMQAELRSREVLVGWVALCLSHACTQRAHPLLQQYGIGVCWQDLRHLVLSDRLAVDAALAVVQYVRQHTRHGLAVFTLADRGKATFELASTFGQQDERLRRLWSQEQRAAEARMDAHWQEVQRKQQLAKELRAELARRQREERSAEDDLEDASWRRFLSWQSQDATLRPLRQALQEAQEARRKTEAKLQAALEPPMPVIQPLPQERARAAAWLFFLYMPPLFRQLARLTFLAQQLLLPPSCAADTLRLPGPKTSLVSHYNGSQQGTWHPESTGRSGSDGSPALVKLVSDKEAPASSEILRPYRDVDAFKSREDGVWYPDTLELRMGYCGTNSAADGALRSLGHFNPWAPLAASLFVEAFTEALPAGFEALQWCMPLYGSREATGADRGNLAIARQDLKPAWMSKPGYLAFGALRAYPTTQMRQLAVALRERTLPLGQPAVQTLVRQALYHCGTLTDEEAPALLWRTDWTDGDMLGTLCAELAVLAAELEHAPREYASVLLLGEMSAYLAAWHPPLKAVARRFGAAAARWADDLEESAAQAAPDEARPIRAKQCLLRQVALLCTPRPQHGARLEDADVACLLGLAVLVHHGTLYGPGTPLEKQMAELQVRCHWTLARHSHDVVAAAEARPDMLTAALRRVLQRAPAELTWQRLCTIDSDMRTASFQALSADGHLYSINCLDGTVLEDGVPPGRLPREVLEHRLYSRTFAAWGFEVTTTAAGAWRSIAPVQGRFYEFWLTGEGGLGVAEIEPTAKAAAAAGPAGTKGGTTTSSGGKERRLELLDPGEQALCKGWGADLPIRLREGHSHWLSREEGAIVLRPHHFRNRQPHFVLTWQASSASASPAKGGSHPLGPTVRYDCRRVPQHLQGRHWSELLPGGASRAGLTDQLVLHDSGIMRVLCKFEDRRFIHAFVDPWDAPSGDDANDSMCLAEYGCRSISGDSSSDNIGSGSSTSSSTSSGEVIIVTRGTSCSDGDTGASSAPRRQMLFELPRFNLRFELRGGELLSLDYAGRCLAPCQQLLLPAAGLGGGVASIYTLPDFSQYLVLQGAQQQEGAAAAPDATAFGAGQQQGLLMLVPVGQVQRRDGDVRLAHGSGSHDKLQHHKYWLHPRFQHLCAESVEARLQLAALYAATSSLLPEPGSRMTGAQVAARLLRQSWGVRPLTPEEQQQLADAARLGAHLTPALPLLAHELRVSACQLHALHFPDGAPPHAQPPAFNPDWGTAYEQHLRHSGSSSSIASGGGYSYRSHSLGIGGAAGCMNAREVLTPEEEQRVMGHSRPADSGGASCHSQPLWRRLGCCEPLQVDPCPVDPRVVPDTEATLCQLVVHSKPPAEVPPYPLSIGSGREGGSGGASATTPLEEAMHRELQESWDAHHSLQTAVYLVPGASEVIAACKTNITRQRQRAEQYLNQHLERVPTDQLGSHGIELLLHQASAAAPQHGPLDLVRLALDAAVAQEFNPFLSEKAAAQLRQGARLWLQLCVLEDRLTRLNRLAGLEGRDAAAALPELLQELQVRRTWEVNGHPAWLAFEAEQQLQIRPFQHWLAAHLIDNPGHILQLNMGEGKTRVIVPMLILHWANGNELVRLTLLPALLEEAYSHLHGCLCASVLNRKLFVQPFHRDVRVTKAAIAAMKSSLQYCKQVGGVLLTTPERRLSQHLKCLELLLGGEPELSAKLDELSALPWVDILDESDELLTHRFQLIYAVGSPQQLPSLPSRTRAIEALLHVLSRDAPRPDTAVGAILAREGVSVPAGPGHSKPGAFRGVRLLPGAALESALPQLRLRLAEAVLEEPPYALRWLRGHPSKEIILTCITDRLVDASKLLSSVSSTPEGSQVNGTASGGAAMQQNGSARPLTEEQQHDVLALRGLLAAEVLEYNLQLRHQVNFGVNRNKPSAAAGSKPRKRMAVPFRAARVPSDRTEFAHPDTSLLLTFLSYFDDGLSEKGVYGNDELLEALRQLLQLGPNAQQEEYGEWLALARADVAPGVLAPVDSVRKLDPTNPTQLALLRRLFSHNVAAVCFFLRTCVFPGDTKQYPQRMGATAWHLADNPRGRVVGFSGTNDSHRLLPLQVRQHLDVERGLKSTNGRMLHILLACPEYYTLEPARGEECWQALLRFAVERGFDAVIDCGALLAGTTNRRAANQATPANTSVCDSHSSPSAPEGHGCRWSSAAGHLPQLCCAWQSHHALLPFQLAFLALCLSLAPPPSCTAAADFLLPRLDRARFSGACYFDEAMGGWAVADHQGRRLPRHCSPIQESQCVTLFDEARCRGADLRLRQGATGLLTLGPATCKDKLMQAAGRMRKLGKGQRLCTIGTADVTAKIRRLTAGQRAASNSSQGLSASSEGSNSEQLTSRHVLQFVMHNTVGATLKGVVEWAHQGLQYAASWRSPAHAVQDEVLQLEELYAASRQLQEVPGIIQQHAEKRLQVRADLAPAMRQLMRQVADQGAQHGQGHSVVAQVGLGEECERELEREEEEEEEVERQVPKVEPHKETDWDYTAALTATSLPELWGRAGLQLLPLAELARQLSPAGIGDLPWSTAAFATPNFAYAVQQAPGQPLNEYLRPVSALLLLPAGVSHVSTGHSSRQGGSAKEQLAVVLLSERECDGLLEAMWRQRHQLATAQHDLKHSGHSRAAPLLDHLCYACQAQPSADGQGGATNAAPAPPRLAMAVTDSWHLALQAGDPSSPAAYLAAGGYRSQLVSLQLFNGETTYVEGQPPAGANGGAAAPSSSSNADGSAARWRALAAHPQLQALRALVSGRGEAAEALVAMRGKQAMYLRSQLEQASDPA